MAEGAERNRDHLRAGLFVVLGLGLAIGTFIALQKVAWEARSEYVIHFKVENGVTGLTPGSEVRVGGLKRGRILSIISKTQNGVLDEIDVTFELDASLPLFADAKALRVAPLLGNTAWINFTSLGNATDVNGDGTIGDDEGALKSGGAITAIEAPGLLANIAGSKSAEEIVTIISRAEQFSTVFERAPKDYEERLVPSLDAARETIVQLRNDYMQWRTKVDNALTSAETAAKNLEDGTESANELIADARATLSENRPKLGNALTNLEAASVSAKDVAEALRTQTIPQIAAVLSKGETAVGDFADLLDRLDGEIAAKLPDLRTFVSDMRVAASQLKLATIEVRRSPWRLLYKPSVDVLAHEQLYEATRSFAAASGDLRSAAEGLQELLRVRPDLVGDKDLRDRLQSSLIEALGRYEETQRRLHGVLLDEPASADAPPAK
jgi:ABC-type transporter Mla subunit MlaD